MTSSEKFYEKILKAEKLAEYTDEVCLATLGTYEKLLAVKKRVLGEEVISENETVYRVVLNNMVYNWMLLYLNSNMSDSMVSEYPGLVNLLKSGKAQSVFNEFRSKVGNIDDESIPTDSEMKTLLMSFGLQEANSDNIIDVLDEDLEEEWDDYEIDEEVETTDENEQYNEDESIEAEIEALKEIWGEKLDSVIDGVMNTFKRLYESGYSLLTPTGILTNVGIIKATPDGSIKQTGNRAIDVEVFKAILDELPVGYNLYAGNGAEPDIIQIEKSPEPVIYTDLHLQCMYGYLKLGKGNRSIAKYVKEHGINVEGSTKVKRYSDMVDWIRGTLEYYFYKAYIDKGVSSKEIRNIDYDITNKVNEQLSHNFRNVIAVCERKKGVNTRIRVCSDTEINVEALKSAIENRLNVGASNSIEVTQIGEYKDGVVDLNIIYNKKKYSQDALFAYQVLDILDEQGLKHSWDNVILGKRDDGTIMTYNFKDKRNPTYALYAESRSGKGVMSLTLLSSALADNCKVMYNDGKPDMGSVLADIAWKNGLDACVYNGVAGKGTELLENRGNCIRQESPFMFRDDVPKGIFITESEKEKFMLITTYLKGIELICETAAYRASKNLPSSDWVVAFVDECEQAAVAEIDVLSFMERAETNRKEAKDENGKKIDLSKDEAYMFIRRYKDWLQTIESKFKTCITSTFGYANMTTFFVWQSTKFPEKYKNKSTIAKVVDSASGHIVKIIGRGAAVNYGSSVFGTPTSLKDAKWYDNRFSGEQGGFFAIGKDVRSNNMQVFRPFNVFTDANNKGLILENAKAAGLSERDLIDVSLDHNGNVIPEVGFEGYTNKLLGKYGLKAHEQLNIGYRYATEVIKSIGRGDNLNYFMYDCIDFDGKLGDSGNREVRYNNENAYGESPEFIEGDTEEFEETIDFGEEETVDSEAYSFKGTFTEEKVPEKKNEQARVLSDYARAVRDFNRASQDIDNVSDEVEISSDFGDVSISMVNGRQHVEINGNTNNVIKLDKDNSVDIGEEYTSKFDVFKGKLVESQYGVNYQFRKRWEAVLNAISSSFPNNSMVIRVSVLSDGIIVNNRIVDTTALTEDEYGIYLEDIINIKALMKRFRFTKSLTLDTNTLTCLFKEYGVDPAGLAEIFKQNSVLESIDVYVADGTEHITRSSILKNQGRYKEMSDEAVNKQKIEQVAAMNNKKFTEKGAGYANKVSNTSIGLAQTSLKKAKGSVIGRKKKKYVSGVFWVSAAVVTGTVGGLAYTVGKIFNRFK